MCSLTQYAAAHDAAVTSVRSSRGTIEVAGADRSSFLHALLTNDIASLVKGTGAYAAYLTPQGRMISDMTVLETGDRILLGVERLVAAALAARLESLVFSEDVRVVDVSEGIDDLGVHGRTAAHIVEQVTGVAAQHLTRPYDNVTVTGLTVVRDDAFGVTGFDIYAARSERARIVEALIAAGAVAAGDEVLDVLRIEAGRPRFGMDMSTDTIPLEAGIEQRAISFTKGCYVGQEVIVRVMHRGHGRVARRLVRLILSGSVVPVPGDKVFAGDQPVGEITSAVDSPKVQAPMAFAYVHRDHAVPGGELSVNGSEARLYQPVD